jgi:hemolysin activation/secretion protein
MGGAVVASARNRLPVTSVIIEGVVPYPDSDITQENIHAVIDKKLREEQAIDLDINGFTQRDLKDIGAYLREVVDRGGVRGGVDRQDFVALLDLVERQDFQRGWITIEQLDAIATAVTDYYRERGFILATAFVPEQEVTDGVIRLNVLEGLLGNITVSNNKVFSAATISAALINERGKPVTEERIESAIRRINDVPGFRVRGSFSPGQKVGETNLNLGVLEEQSWESSLRVDNHGSETTGETRVYALTQWNNVLNRGHRVTVGMLGSEGPDSSLFGQIEYEMPVTKDGRGRLKTSFSSNEFAVAATATVPEVIGETDNYNVTWSYQYLRSRTKKLSVQIAYTQKDVLFQVVNSPNLSSDQKLEVVSFATDYTKLWDDRQFLFTGRLALDQGHMISGERDNQSIDFSKLVVNLSLLKRIKLPEWVTDKDYSFNVVLKSNGQYTEKFLSSVEQFSLGGANAVRAFGVSDISVDSGVYAGLEILFEPINLFSKAKFWFGPLKPFLFFDYAYGVSHNPDGNRAFDSQIKGYGLGFKLNWARGGLINFIFATPHSSSHEENVADLEGQSRIYFDVVYKFR